MLWQTALQSLAASGKENGLSRWLHPQHSSQSPEGVAAILLGNLVQAAGAGLQVSSDPSQITSEFPGNHCSRHPCQLAGYLRSREASIKVGLE